MAGQNNRLPDHQQVSNAPRLAGFFLVGFFEQLGNDGLVLPEVRRSVAIATAFAFLRWAWHVRCHMHGAVLEHCFRLSSQNRKELHIKNPQKTPLKIVSLIDISRAREENCCVLLGAKLSGLSFIPHLACPRTQLSN